jgi:hypothetical protein
MATLNFDESIVLILFAQSGGSLTPTRAEIIQFDADLQSTFGARLQQIMTEEGLEIDVHSRSLVLGCRPHMPGNTPAMQIRRACRYVLSAHQVLAAATPLSVAPLDRSMAASPAPVKRAAKRAARGRGKSRPTTRTRKARNTAKRRQKGGSKHPRWRR